MKVVMDIPEVYKRLFDNGIQEVEDLCIEKLPSAKTTINSEKTTITDTDLISRTDLLNKIFQQAEGRDYDGQNMLNLPYVDLIESMPTIPAEPKTAEWIFHKPFDNGHKNCNDCIECSQCHTWFGYDCYAKTLYCPNCGARMEK